MPRGDGIGPDGLGPITGRGLGRRYRGRRLSKGSIWGTIITAIAGTVIKDLSSPNSKIKKLTRNIFKPKEIEVLEIEKKDEITSVDNTAIANVSHGAGPQTAQKLFELNPDILITGNGLGGNAARVLQNSNIKIYIGAGDMTVKEAYNAFKEGKLTQI